MFWNDKITSARTRYRQNEREKKTECDCFISFDFLFENNSSYSIACLFGITVWSFCFDSLSFIYCFLGHWFQIIPVFFLVVFFCFVSSSNVSVQVRQFPRYLEFINKSAVHTLSWGAEWIPVTALATVGKKPTNLLQGNNSYRFLLIQNREISVMSFGGDPE